MNEKLTVVNSGLVPIYENDDRERMVNARDLHGFLESGWRFADWIKERIEKYGFIQGEDFEVFQEILKNPQGGRPTTEYLLTLDTAKEIAMVENNEKGRQVRRYFIRCEKALRSVVKQAIAENYHVVAPIANDALNPAAHYEELKERCIKRFLERPAHVTITAWEKKLQEEFGVCETTLRRWRNEGLPGFVLQRGDGPYSTEIRLGGYSLVMNCYSFDQGAMQWAADHLLKNPKARASDVYKKMVAEAEIQGWRTGCAGSFYYHVKRIRNLIVEEKQLSLPFGTIEALEQDTGIKICG